MKILGLLNRINENILNDPIRLDSYVLADIKIEEFDGATMKAFDYSAYEEGIKYFRVCHKSDTKLYNTNGDKEATTIPEESLAQAIELQKIILFDKLDRYMDTLFQNSIMTSDIELSTWAKQESEAKAYKLDINAVTPFLDMLSISRGIDKAVLVEKILEKSSSFMITGAQIIGTIQSIKDKVKSAKTILDMKNISYPSGISLHIFTKFD